MRAYLSLGSNKGDRNNNLKLATDAISSLPETVVEAVSEMIETKAAGLWNGRAGKFLNCCCRIETTLEPLTLLDRLQEIEVKLGRPSHVEKRDVEGRRIYSDRTIDIDILLYGDMHIDTGRLQIPHPHMLERDFVMTPLKSVLE